MSYYLPKQGDIVWLDFDNQNDNKAKDRRLALIVWGNDALEMMPMMSQICAISDTDNSFPLHVKVNAKDTSGFIACEQTKVVNLKQRHCEYKDHVNDETLQVVINNLKILLD